MRIKDIPKEGRPRERFLRYGVGVLSDAELFAIILRTGYKGENVIDVSNRLIAEYGLDKLFECSLKELQGIKGIGPAKAMQLLAMSELGKRQAQAKKPIKKITCAKDVFDLFHDRLKDEKQEHFIVLMLNNMNNIIAEQLVSIGTMDSTIFDAKTIFKPVLKNSASKIVLIHNHPSGNPEPSREDIEITNEIFKAGEMVGVRVLDHIIVGNGIYWSWRENPIRQ